MQKFIAQTRNEAAQFWALGSLVDPIVCADIHQETSGVLIKLFVSDSVPLSTYYPYYDIIKKVILNRKFTIRLSEVDLIASSFISPMPTTPVATTPMVVPTHGGPTCPPGTAGDGVTCTAVSIDFESQANLAFLQMTTVVEILQTNLAVYTYH